MRVLLATLLSLLVGTAAGQCDTAGYTQCLAEHLSSANPNKCATAGFTGDAMCACQAQSAVCAKRFKCPEMCETTMTALSCGAAWCKVSNVSKPIRFTTVYRFTKEITNSQLWSLIVKNLSPAINTNWVSIDDILDTSVQTPSPTLSPNMTRDDVNKGCPKLIYPSDCEELEFGLCRWTGTACVPSGKKLPSEEPTRGGSESGSESESESGSGSESESGSEGKSTARVAAVLAGGPWEATVKVEIKKEDSASPDVYMNDALVAQLPNQMDTMATTGDFKSYGATVEQSTVSEKANEGTAGGGGSDGMSTGAIIGIVAGCLVGIALVGVVGFMVVKRQNTANMNSPPPKASANDYQDMQKLNHMQTV